VKSGTDTVLTADTGNIQGTNGKAGGYSHLWATQDIDAAQILAVGEVTAGAGQSVTNASFTSQTSTVDVTAENVDVTNTDVVANQKATVTAKEDIDGSSITSEAADVALLAQTGSISATDASAYTSIDGVAGLNIVGGSFFAKTGKIDLDAMAGNMVGFTAVTTGAAANATVDLDAQLDITGVTVDAVGTVKLGLDVEGRGNKANDIVGSVVDTDSDAWLKAEAEIDSTEVTAGNDISAVAGTYIVSSSFTAINGSIDVLAILGNVVDSTLVVKDADNTNDETATVEAGAELDDVVVSSIGSVTGTAGTWIVDGAFISEEGSVTLTANRGSITGTTAESKVSFVDADATQDINGMTVDAGTSADLNAGLDIAGNAVNADGYAVLTAWANVQGGNVNAGTMVDIVARTGDVDGITAFGGGAVTGTANQSVTNASFTSTGSTVTVTAENVDVTNTDVVANLLAKVTAKQDVIGSSVVSEAGNVEITAQTGSVSATDASAIGTNGKVTVLADVDIVAGSADADSTVKLTATKGEINGTVVETNADALLTARLDIVGVSVDAATALLKADEDIAGGVVSVTGEAELKANADLSGSGDIAGTAVDAATRS
jgi:hypothetical protein